jgi:hypothetical protein
MMAVSASAIAGLWVAYQYVFIKPYGIHLNHDAWEASFRERGLAVPPGGPRDGYWGRKIPRIEDPHLVWRLGEAHLPGLVDEDEDGFQHVAEPGARRHLLIIGASVAWGAYASSIETTYFARMAQRLSQEGCPVRVTVLAAGGWTSWNEIRAFRRSLSLAPDFVLFLDGLNDFLVGGGGSEDEVVAAYLSRMRRARDLARQHGITIVFALQPSLLQKKVLSRLERRIVMATFRHARDGFQMTKGESRCLNGFARIRAGLRDLAKQEGVAFVDCSAVFDDERATTFTDVWHFADPGHALLGAHLADGLVPVLAERERQGGTTPRTSDATSLPAH